MIVQGEQIELATPAGFEPATFSLEGCCSSDLGDVHEAIAEAFFSDLVAGPAKPLIRWRARQDFDLVTSAFGGRGASQQGATHPCVPKFPLTS